MNVSRTATSTIFLTSVTSPTAIVRTPTVTVCRTNVLKDARTDRTSKRDAEKRKRMLDKLRAADWRERKRSLDQLPNRIAATQREGEELIKAAKGLDQ